MRSICPNGGTLAEARRRRSARRATTSGLTSATSRTASGTPSRAARRELAPRRPRRRRRRSRRRARAPSTQRVLEQRARTRPSASAARAAGRRARGVQRARAAPVAHARPPRRERHDAAARRRPRRRSARRSAPSVSAARRPRDARVVGAGDRPTTGCSSPARVAATSPVPGAERAHGLAARVEQRDRAPVGARRGVDAAAPPGPSSSGGARGRSRTRGPRADDDAQRVLAGRGSSGARVWRRRRSSSRVVDLVARGRRGPAHSTRTGSRLPSLPCRNGSGNEPTTAGTRIAALPVVVVPPDAVARRAACARRRALRRLDAVDVVEPVDRPAAARPPRDAVDRTARTRRRSASSPSNVRCSRRITVSRLARRLAAGVGAKPVAAEVRETVTVTAPPDCCSAGPKPQPATTSSSATETGGASSDGEHHPRGAARQRRAVARAVDRDRVEHVAAPAQPRREQVGPVGAVADREVLLGAAPGPPERLRRP